MKTMLLLAFAITLLGCDVSPMPLQEAGDAPGCPMVVATQDSPTTCIWAIPAGVACASVQVRIDGSPVDRDLVDVICGSGQVVLAQSACEAAKSGVVTVSAPCE